MPVSGNPIFLHESIKSIIAQSHEEFEAVIVLNHSDKWVKEYLDSIVLADNRFRVLETCKRGISNALNIGIESAKSDLICRLDSDDVMAANRLQLQVNYLNLHPTIGVLGSQVIYIDQNGLETGVSRFPTENPKVAKLLRVRNVIAHSSTMFRKSLFESVGAYNSAFDGVEDYDLWLRVNRIAEIENMEQALTNYRRWPNQVTSNYGGRATELIKIITIKNAINEEKMSPPIGLENSQLHLYANHFVIHGIVKLLRKAEIKLLFQTLALLAINSGIERLVSKDGYLRRLSGLAIFCCGSAIYPIRSMKIFLLPKLGRRNSSHAIL